LVLFVKTLVCFEVLVLLKDEMNLFFHFFPKFNFPPVNPQEWILDWQNIEVS
jgi:hypothetical protein